jgi:hypothetical protein
MQHRQPSLRGYGAGEDGGGPAHVAEVILCDMWEMALLSHFPAPEMTRRTEPVAKRPKSEMEILELLQRYDAILAIVRKWNGHKAVTFVETISQSLKQTRAWLRASPRPVPLAKLSAGLRQGLRELPRSLQSMMVDACPSDREKILTAINGSGSPAFLKEQADKAREVMLRRAIRNEDEWYLLRWRLDQIEGQAAHQEEITLLWKLLDAYQVGTQQAIGQN